MGELAEIEPLDPNDLRDEEDDYLRNRRFAMVRLVEGMGLTATDAALQVAKVELGNPPEEREQAQEYSKTLQRLANTVRRDWHRRHEWMRRYLNIGNPGQLVEDQILALEGIDMQLRREYQMMLGGEASMEMSGRRIQILQTRTGIVRFKSELYKTVGLVPEVENKVPIKFVDEQAERDKKVTQEEFDKRLLELNERAKKRKDTAG